MNSMNNFNIFVESLGYCWIECLLVRNLTNQYKSNK